MQPIFKQITDTEGQLFWTKTIKFFCCSVLINDLRQQIANIRYK